MFYKCRSISKQNKQHISLSKSTRCMNTSFSPAHLTNNKYLPFSPSARIISNNNHNKNTIANNTLSYNDYSTLLQTSMHKYKGTSQIELDDNTIENTKSILNETQHFITKAEKMFIDKISKHNSITASYPHIKSTSTSSANTTTIIIPTKYADYINAYHSLGVIKSNNNIVNKINKTTLSRQKILYNNSITTFEKNSTKYKMKMPKIRVRTLHKAPQDIPEVHHNKAKEEHEHGHEHERDNNNNNMNNNTTKNTQTHSTNSHCDFNEILSRKNVLVAYYRYPQYNSPECRQQFSLVLHKDKIILLGGMCSVMQTTYIWSLNPNKLLWTRIKAKNISANKFGHTCVAFHNKLFVYGGRTKMSINNNKEAIDTLNGLDVFNLTDENWLSLSVSQRNAPTPRYNHIAELIGSYMLIHGGIDENNDIVDSIYILVIQSTMKWIKPPLQLFNKGPALYGHSSSIVIPSHILNHYRFNIFKYPDNVIGGDDGCNVANIQMIGLYIFGGMPKHNSTPSNDMWVLLIGKKAFEWKRIDDVKGIKPTPRYFHSMNYYEKGNFIIIHGGRNDSLSNSFALNDTYLFKLDTFEWVKIELFSHVIGFKILNRCAHDAVIYSNKLIIFGGMNSLNYLGSALLIVNLDQEENKNITYIGGNFLTTNTENDDEAILMRIKRYNKLKHSLGVITDFSLPPIQ